MRYRIKVEWENEDGGLETAELGKVESGSCSSDAKVGLQLAAAQELMGRLQQLVITQQLHQYCQTARCCPSCQTLRNVKDYRTRTLDTVLGRVLVNAPRFHACRACGQRGVVSPLTSLLPTRLLPELRHLQAKLAAELSYRRAAELLRELLPQTGGLTPMTTRNRTLRIGRTIEAELCHEIDHPQTHPNPSHHLTVGIDGAFVKAKRKGGLGRQHFEILTGRIEREQGQGKAFAIVRDLDKRAKQKVQAVLRRAGRTSETAVTVLSDGEDGLRGVVGWFGRQYEHRLDWFHVARRLDQMHKLLLYLPSSPVYGRRLAFHARNLKRIKYQLWNSGIEMADWGMRIFRAGLAEDAWDSLQHLQRFQHLRRSWTSCGPTYMGTQLPYKDTRKPFGRESACLAPMWNQPSINSSIGVSAKSSR